MFRRWLSAFWRDNKEKIIQVAKVFGILIAIGASAGLIFSTFNLNNKGESNTISEIYVPEQTIISGSNLSEEEYKEENNLAETFVNYCNEQKIEEAYNLLTDECKEKIYPTLQDFKNNYYNIIFQESRIYTLQSWINEKKYNTYKISYTQNFMATGNYDETEKYEDYITIVTDEENQENKKININNYIKTEELNEKTKTDKLEIEALNVDTYMNYVIYTIRVKNITDKDILLDNLDSYNNIKLIGTNGVSYKIESTNLKTLHLQINAGEQKEINLTFRKQYGSSVFGSSIEFKNVITDYSQYVQSKENYNEFEGLSIKL